MSLQNDSVTTFNFKPSILLLGTVGDDFVGHAESELVAGELTLHLCALGEGDVDACDVLCVYAEALEGLSVGLVSVFCADAAASGPLLLFVVPYAALDGGAERTEVTKSDAVAEFELLDDHLFESEEAGLDVDLRECTLVLNALHDLGGRYGAVERNLGIPGLDVCAWILSLNPVPSDCHSSVFFSVL